MEKDIKIPEIKKGDLITITGADYNYIKAVVEEIYSDEIKEKFGDFCGDIQVVYKETGSRAVKTDAIWNKDRWEFKNNGPSGGHVDINAYPQLK